MSGPPGIQRTTLLTALAHPVIAGPEKPSPDDYERYATITAITYHFLSLLVFIPGPGPFMQANTPPYAPEHLALELVGPAAVSASASYGLWGYPEDAYHELDLKKRPDMVFSAGHISRRMSEIPIPAIRGSSFFELSTVAGPGLFGKSHHRVAAERE